MSRSPLLPVAEAQARLKALARPIADIETLSLSAADGRVLAAPLDARLNHPPFPASAMDGYAVRAQDCLEPGVLLTVTGESAAGDPPSGPVGAGQAWRIFTGAPLPHGADTVVIQENTDKPGGDTVRLWGAVTAGANVRPQGLDFRAGARLLPEGSTLDFRSLSLVAAAGYSAVDCYRRPRVKIVATGNELVSPGHLPGVGQIVASSGTGIAALLRNNGADAEDCGIAADDAGVLAATFTRALSEKPDVLVTIGGASVGDHDLVRPTLADMGMALDFWKVAMRPGKPLMVGMLDGTIVIGLPGNPVSSFICALVFLEPLIRHLGRLEAKRRAVPARLGSDIPANGEREAYLRARLTRDAAGALIARPLDNQDSSLLSVLADADALIIRPANGPALTTGAATDVLLF